MMSEKAVCDFQIKMATEKDEIYIKKLWQEVFGDNKEFIDRFYNTFPMKGNTFVAKIGEKIVGMVNAVDCKLLYGSELFYGKYIYALAVEKACRGKGIARKLLEISESGRNDSFVLLVPETPDLFDMYDHLGYKQKSDVDIRFVDPCLFFTDGKSDKSVSALVKIKDNELESFEEKKADFFIQG